MDSISMHSFSKGGKILEIYQLWSVKFIQYFKVLLLIFQLIIGKYLSRLCKLDHVIVLKAGFETQLRAPRLAIPFGMSALGMTGQRGDGRLHGGIEPHHVSTLPDLDKVA